MKRYLTLVVAFVMALTLTACLGGKKDYKEYAGYSFDGNDPWGNSLSVNLKEFKDDKFTWSFNVVIGEGEDSITLSNEFTNDIKDDVINFTVKGTSIEDENLSYEYTGTLTLKDEKVVVKYEKGQVTESSPEGGSAAYQAEGLDKNEVTLTKAATK